jgi:hypothetical protein
MRAEPTRFVAYLGVDGDKPGVVALLLDCRLLGSADFRDVERYVFSWPGRRIEYSDHQHHECKRDRVPVTAQNC